MDYIPEKGDIFEWCDEEYICIETGSQSGTVNPIGETYYLRQFYWNFEGYKCKFLRKAPKSKLLSMGIESD